MLCPDWTHPSGGVRRIYRHVEVLNSLGYRAFVLHQSESFRCQWFESSAPLAQTTKCWPLNPEHDLLVCPEYVAWQMVKATPGVPKIIFNQGAYHTFRGMSEKFESPPYLSPEFLGTIVVSDDSRAYLNYAFPAHPVARIRHAIDSSLFYPSEQKSRRITYMPRKLPADARQVMAILNQRGLVGEFEFSAIENMTESQTAHVLRDAMVFLNFCSQEGFSLPPLEAMACGCLVIGYDGQGGREYLNNDLAVRIAEEDILGFVKAIEAAVHDFRHTPETLATKTRRAMEYVATYHSPEREREDIAAAWQQLSAPTP